ncbi:hypothetical protein ISCGN_021688 [Ixodes scapularis]
MDSLLLQYNDILHAHPVITQVLTVGTVALAGDVISQTFIQNKPSFDFRQAIIYYIVGLFFTGTLTVLWLMFVEWLVVTDGVAGAAIKTALGLVFFTPPFFLCFLVVHGFLSGHSWEAIRENIRTKYFVILKSRYAFYPVAQFVNFEFVPILYRAIYLSVVALLWNMYLSWKTNQVSPCPPVEPSEKTELDPV